MIFALYPEFIGLPVYSGPIQAFLLGLSAADPTSEVSDMILRKIGAWPTVWAAVVVLSACKFAPAKAESTQSDKPAWQQVGRATFYNSRYTGHRTASGAAYDPSAMTAAHQWLPIGTRVQVMREDCGRSVIVTINDRQAHSARILDLSHAAAEKLGIIGQGTAKVRLIPLSLVSTVDEDGLQVQDRVPRATRTDRRIKHSRKSLGARHAFVRSDRAAHIARPTTLAAR